MKPLRIVISVPHAESTLRDGRTHDMLAWQAAEALAKQLFQQTAVASVTVLAHAMDRPRSEVDMNRWPARNEPFREHLRQLWRQGSPPWQLVAVDMHSFPDRHRPGTEFYVIDTPAGERLSALGARLKRDGVTVLRAARQHGGNANDIVREAQQYTPLHVLVEVNESLAPVERGIPRTVYDAPAGSPLAEWAARFAQTLIKATGE